MVILFLIFVQSRPTAGIFGQRTEPWYFCAVQSLDRNFGQRTGPWYFFAVQSLDRNFGQRTGPHFWPVPSVGPNFFTNPRRHTNFFVARGMFWGVLFCSPVPRPEFRTPDWTDVWAAPYVDRNNFKNMTNFLHFGYRKGPIWKNFGGGSKPEPR